MKIVHLNTHSYGGAAVVARRLHRAALADGIDSAFITKYGLRSDRTPRYRSIHDARLLYTLRRRAADPRLYKVGKFLQQKLEHKNLVNRPAGFEVFSPLNTSARYSDCVDSISPNIVHLHWVAGFVDHQAFFERNRVRRFVWTLHDMNPITGGCHHADGCGEFKGGCAVCPQLLGTIDPAYASGVLTSKVAALSGLRDQQMTIVAPSKWLLDLSRSSAVTARFRHVQIANPSFGPFEQVDPADAKASLGLPLNKKIILFVSDNLRNPRKGISLLFEAVRSLSNAADVQLLGIGQRTDLPDDLPVIFTGTISDEQVLARYFSSADVLVNASSAENSPLTVIEALTCGTPVIAFNVGGIPEIVGALDGVLIDERTASALGEALEEVLLRREFDRGGIRARAAQHAPRLVLERYKQVYEELLAS